MKWLKNACFDWAEPLKEAGGDQNRRRQEKNHTSLYRAARHRVTNTHNNTSKITIQLYHCMHSVDGLLLSLGTSRQHCLTACRSCRGRRHPPSWPLRSLQIPIRPTRWACVHPTTPPPPLLTKLQKRTKTGECMQKCAFVKHIQFIQYKILTENVQIFILLKCR